MAKIAVAPLVGAWIEIMRGGISKCPARSHALSQSAWIEIRHLCGQIVYGRVAPLVGAWIEICLWPDVPPPLQVAPLVGAWIEMMML